MIRPPAARILVSSYPEFYWVRPAEWSMENGEFCTSEATARMSRYPSICWVLLVFFRLLLSFSQLEKFGSFRYGPVRNRQTDRHATSVEAVDWLADLPQQTWPQARRSSDVILTSFCWSQQPQSWRRPCLLGIVRRLQLRWLARQLWMCPRFNVSVCGW